MQETPEPIAGYIVATNPEHTAGGWVTVFEGFTKEKDAEAYARAKTIRNVAVVFPMTASEIANIIDHQFRAVGMMWYKP